uniref:TH1 domain-containing protein n=1 Tax=Angiostrongylus cantonensis TaxID=6313 RepID=A0A0K0DJQ7_ANGCA
MGSLSAEQVKHFKQGLPEVLLDEQFPSKFAFLVKIEADDAKTNTVTISLARKLSMFHNYETMRRDNVVHIQDNKTMIVNPLTGRKVPRSLTSIGDPTQAVYHSEPRNKFLQIDRKNK